jgi:hypothetical protein
MKKCRRQRLLQAACCLLCAVLLMQEFDEAGESIGGRFTGPLFHMAEIGWALFALAPLLTFVYRRFAAAVGLAGCVLHLPLFLYVTAPGPFRWVFRSAYSVPLQATFVWGIWESVKVLALGATTYVCLRGLSPNNDESVSQT